METKKNGSFLKDYSSSQLPKSISENKTPLLYHTCLKRFSWKSILCQKDKFACLIWGSHAQINPE